MKREFLERLYWACSDWDAADADGTRLNELYERTEETEEADHCFSEKLCTLDIPTEDKNLLDNLCGSTAMVYEIQGFINGFRLGMKLAGELGEEAEA